MKPFPCFPALTVLTLLTALTLSGCGYLTASADVDAAIEAAARENLANFRTATQDKANVRDRELARLDAALDERILTSADGLAALNILQSYRIKRAEMLAARSADLANYAKAVDNATLIVELIGQRIALAARWNALMGRIPAIAHIKAMAEVESRAFINAIATPP